MSMTVVNSFEASKNLKPDAADYKTHVQKLNTFLNGIQLGQRLIF